MADSDGALHPRGFGAAAQCGLYLGVPTIGVSKDANAARQKRGRRGEQEPIAPDRAAFLTTRGGVKPVCVSPGHLIDLDSSLRLVLAWSRFRIPEPIRAADHWARKHCRETSTADRP